LISKENMSFNQINGLNLSYLQEYPLKSLEKLLIKTTQNHDECLWNKIFDFEIDLSCLNGLDSDVNKALTNLCNPQLVFSLMLHNLGRAVFCCNTVYYKFKHILKKSLKESCDDCALDQDCNYKRRIHKLETKLNIEDLIAPSELLSKDLKNEAITWNQYLIELEVHDNVMTKMKEKCNDHDLTKSSSSLLHDLLAFLLFENYCCKSFNGKSSRESLYTVERQVVWHFPLDIKVNLKQTKELYGHRNDIVLCKSKSKNNNNDYKFNYKKFKSNLNICHNLKLFLAYTEEMKSNEEIKESMGSLKKGSSMQAIYELILSMFGIEVQKNPAAIIYNMMVLDLMSGKYVFHFQIYFNWD
jgi:hypothetical protein